MKKLITCALVLTALASCKKEDPNAETLISIDMRCKVCEVTYPVKGGYVTDTIKRILVISSYPVRIGSAVNITMRNIEPGTIQLAIGSMTGRTRWLQKTDDNYPVGMLFYNSVVIK